jgi:hypothetical protein
MKIVELKAYPTSFPLPPDGSVTHGIGVEVDEEFLVKHPVIEGPSYV